MMRLCEVCRRCRLVVVVVFAVTIWSIGQQHAVAQVLWGGSPTVSFNVGPVGSTASVYSTARPVGTLGAQGVNVVAPGLTVGAPGVNVAASGTNVGYRVLSSGTAASYPYTSNRQPIVTYQLPVVTYRQPIQTGARVISVAPVYVWPRFRVPGQPIRNVIRNAW